MAGSEIIPVEPDQGNACAGKAITYFLLLCGIPFHFKNLNDEKGNFF
jgi:hypothetical protein